MTLAFTASRPAARPFQSSSSLAPRPEAGRALAVVKPAAAPTPDEAVTSGTDQTIGLLEQAAAKMTEALTKLRNNEETISALNQKLVQLQQEKDAADEARRQHAARADDIERIAEELRTAGSLQAREYARLKANADRLLAIFAPDPATT